MIYFRSVLFYLGLGLSTIPFLFVALFALAFSAKARSRAISGWAYFVAWWLRATCGLKHELVNPDNILQEPCVFAGNHSSTWETIVTQTFFPTLAWVLKKELLRIPVFGWGLWATKPIAINRQDRATALDQVISQGMQRFSEGRHVLIFPEGTRTSYGEVGKYKMGAVKLARAGNVPIVPFAHDAGKFWSKDNWLIKPGVIRCVIGPAISTDNKKDTEVLNELKDWIIAQQL